MLRWSSHSSRAAAKNSGEIGVNTTFPLHGFNTDGTDFAGKFAAEIFNIIEADELDTRHYWSEWLAVLRLMRGCDGAHGASMEAMLHRQGTSHNMPLPLRAQETRVGASEFQCSFPCFSAAIAKEHTIQPADLSQTDCEVEALILSW